LIFENLLTNQIVTGFKNKLGKAANDIQFAVLLNFLYFV